MYPILLLQIRLYALQNRGGWIAHKYAFVGTRGAEQSDNFSVFIQYGRAGCGLHLDGSSKSHLQHYARRIYDNARICGNFAALYFGVHPDRIFQIRQFIGKFKGALCHLIRCFKKNYVSGKVRTVCDIT